MNCGAGAGNVTRHIDEACNNQSTCDYVVDIGSSVILRRAARRIIRSLANWPAWRHVGPARTARVGLFLAATLRLSPLDSSLG